MKQQHTQKTKVAKPPLKPRRNYKNELAKVEGFLATQRALTEMAESKANAYKAKIGALERSVKPYRKSLEMIAGQSMIASEWDNNKSMNIERDKTDLEITEMAIKSVAIAETALKLIPE